MVRFSTECQMLVQKILASNHDVMKMFSEKGILTKESAVEVAKASEVVITMLPSSSHAALKVAIETYGGAGKELAALRMEAEKNSNIDSDSDARDSENKETLFKKLRHEKQQQLHYNSIL